MTDQQKIERLAEFMGWHRLKWNDETSQFDPEGKYVGDSYWRDYEAWSPFKDISETQSEDDLIYDFDPLTDWNHWRQVEEKVMEDFRVFDKYVDYFAEIDAPFHSVTQSIKADLNTRVDALLAALDSLSTQK